MQCYRACKTLNERQLNKCGNTKFMQGSFSLTDVIFWCKCKLLYPGGIRTHNFLPQDKCDNHYTTEY